MPRNKSYGPTRGGRKSGKSGGSGGMPAKDYSSRSVLGPGSRERKGGTGRKR